MMCKRLMTLALSLVMALSLTAPAMAAETAEADPVRLAAEAAALFGQATSLQYALWKDGEIVDTGSVGVYSKSENRALTPDILYGIGSVSKIYTTVAVLQLAEEGKLSLDAPVTRYLPAFKMADERYKDITVRMLLNHSSGIMGTALKGAMRFGGGDTSAHDRLLDELSGMRLAADPGALSVYCNDGFTLAELVVEAVSGQSFMDYVRSSILTPAGLENTFAPGDDFDTARLAKTYAALDDPRPLPQDSLNAIGAGGMYATASDLAAFGGALTGETLLTASSLEAMAYPEYSRGLWPEADLPDALAYGLGWDSMETFPFAQNGISALSKGGDTLFYHAGLVVLPEQDMAAAVVTSGGASTYNQMAATQILIAALADEGVTVDQSLPLPAAASPAAMPAAQKANAGYYATTSVQYRVDIAGNGTLTLHALNTPAAGDQAFTYRTDGTFRDESGTACISFVKADNGQTYLYQRTAASLPGLGGLPVSNYAAVKLPENTVSPEVQAVWDKVSAMNVLPMDEPYDSQAYYAISTAAAETTVTAETVEMVPGYMGAARIVDAAKAQFALQVPGTGSRDGGDYTLETRNGVTWLTSYGSEYMDASALRDLYTTGGAARTTIQPDGYARWYAVGDKDAGKTMTVQLPETAGFWVYDANGQVTASSVLWGDSAVTLPEGGLIAFAGDPGDQFQLRFTA